jgi:hypothetical protein
MMTVGESPGHGVPSIHSHHSSVLPALQKFPLVALPPSIFVVIRHYFFLLSRDCFVAKSVPKLQIGFFVRIEGEVTDIINPIACLHADC